MNKAYFKVITSKVIKLLNINQHQIYIITFDLI